MRIDRWINSDEEFNLDSCLASRDRLQRGAGRGHPARTDHDVYCRSNDTAPSEDRIANRDSHACADPGAYFDSNPDSDFGRDRHTCPDLDAHSDYSAGRLLACKQ